MLKIEGSQLPKCATGSLNRSEIQTATLREIRAHATCELGGHEPQAGMGSAVPMVGSQCERAWAGEADRPAAPSSSCHVSSASFPPDRAWFKRTCSITSSNATTATTQNAKCFAAREPCCDFHADKKSIKGPACDKNLFGGGNLLLANSLQVPGRTNEHLTSAGSNPWRLAVLPYLAHFISTRTSLIINARRNPRHPLDMMAYPPHTPYLYRSFPSTVPSLDRYCMRNLYSAQLNTVLLVNARPRRETASCS